MAMLNRKPSKEDVKKAADAASHHPTPGPLRTLANIIGVERVIEASKEVAQRISNQTNKLANGNHEVKNKDQAKSDVNAHVTHKPNK